MGDDNSRPNSFFGLDSNTNDLAATLGPDLSKIGKAGGFDENLVAQLGLDGLAKHDGLPQNSVPFASTPSLTNDGEDEGRQSTDVGSSSNNSGRDAGPGASHANDPPHARVRPSSFFGMEQPTGHVPTPVNDATVIGARNGTADNGLPSIAANINRESAPSPNSIAPSHSASNYGNAEKANAAARPASIAQALNGPLLDHSHLRPGEQAELLSHNKTLELYRLNAKKTNDPDLIFELAVFMIDAAKSMGGDDSSGGTGPAGSGSSTGHQGKEESAREDLIKEAVGLLKKIADRGHPDGQYYLADCYANGIGTSKGKQDFDKAYPLFVLSAKHGHPDAAYRAGMCYEKGWGCRRDAAKAVQFYRKAGAQSHPGAMYRLGTAELNGDLGLKKSAREGVKWLKRSADFATPEFPHALHELALLHERGVDNVLFADPDYACELLAQAGEMGYAPSAYKLGVNYEYGRMGCPQDAGLSIHMYNIAAQQNHKEACFALTAWYLVGAPGILPQSDTEAYLWAKKAAEQGLAKAEYAVGYFTEMGIGCVKDVPASRRWYHQAAEHGDKRANQRLASMGVPQPQENRLLASLGIRRGSEGNTANAERDHQMSEPPMPQKDMRGMSAREQGMRIAAAAEAAARQQSQVAAQRTQPFNAPFASAVERGGPLAPASSSYPTPLQMREVQTAQREQAHQAAVMQQQLRQLPRPPPSHQHSLMSTPSNHSQSSFHSSAAEHLSMGSPPFMHTQSPLSNSSLPQLNQSFSNLHMRNGSSNGHNGPERPPSMQPGGPPHINGRPVPPHDFLRHGPPGPQSMHGGHRSGPPSHISSPPSSVHGGGGGNRSSQSHQQQHRRPPQGAEFAYLHHGPPQRPLQPQMQLPIGGGQNPLRPPMRQPHRQNSAPPGMGENGAAAFNTSYPTYRNQPNPEHTYVPGIPVLQQPQLPNLPLTGARSADHAHTHAHEQQERKKGLWAQLKAI